MLWGRNRWIALLAGMFLTGCEFPPDFGQRATPATAQPVQASGLAGTIGIEGSSTVEPISIRARELFSLRHPRVAISISGQGTSNGYAALGRRECDICDASRPIKAGELETLRASQVSFIELPVAFDGLTIVVNRQNDFVHQLTIAQLQRIFREDLAARTWRDVDPQWPDSPISVYAPGIKSGTHDYFVEILGRRENRGLRSDEQTTLSEDDKQLVLGVRGDRYAIGFFGFAFYEASQANLKAVPVVNPDTGQAVLPDRDTIRRGDYYPFSRPLFIVVSAESCRRWEVREFAAFYLEESARLARDAGFVPLPETVVERARQNLAGGVTGTHFLDPSGHPRTGRIEDIYQVQNAVH